MSNAYIASDFRARRIPARDLQPDDEVLSDDLEVVKIVRRRRSNLHPTGEKTITFVASELLIVGETSTVSPTTLVYDINESVMLLSRRPEPDYVAESV